MTDCSTIVAILQENRVESATKVQDILTEHGCNIRMRLGLHDAAIGSCSATGLILLQFCDEDGALADMTKKLTAIPGVKVKSMALEF